ncbi:hypothetical protein ACFL0S_10475 [Thermodesulfobacteriota bacterium]
MPRTFFSIFAIVGVVVLSQFFEISESYAACGPPTYAGCTGAQLRAIQSGQFNAKKRHPIQSREVRRSDSYSSPDAYWKDRQYQDRKDLEAKNERKEARELEAQTRRYEAKQYSKQRNNYGGTVYVNRGNSVIAKPRPSTNTGQKTSHYNQFGKKVQGKSNVWR